MIFFKDNKNKIIVFVITAVLMVFMIVSSVTRPVAHIFSDTFGIILTPFQSVFTYVSNCFKYASNAEKFDDENTILKQQIITLEKQAAGYDELLRENAKLRSMLDLKKNHEEYELVAANVVSHSPENWTSVIRINKGMSSGIKKNDTAINELGLVGYVSDVGRTWAEITTIIDVSTSVGAVVERVDEHCIVKGDVSQYDSGFCVMKYATTESAIAVGDVLSTAGNSEIYPEGISIGKITEITVNPNGLSQDAVVEPVVDFSELGELFVLTN